MADAEILSRLFSAPAPVGEAFWLDEPETLRWIASGAVDTFLQRRNADGTGGGARHHVCRLSAGGLLVGLDFAQLPEGWGVIAVPLLDTSVRRITCAALTRACADAAVGQEVLAQAQRWVKACMQSMDGYLPPQHYLALNPGETLQAQAGDSLATSHGLVWASLVVGSVNWMDLEELVIHPQEGVLPISRELFLRAQSKLLLQVVDPVWLVTDESLWQALRLHWSLVLRHGLKAMNEHIQRKGARLRQVANQSAILKAQALTRVATVGGSTAAQSIDRLVDQDLLAVLQPIGTRVGVEFKAPPDSDASFFQREPVAAVCAASDVRYRSVTLSGHWWQTDSGPLLGEMQSPKRWVALLPLNDREYEMLDPAGGGRRRVDQALANELNPQAYTFYRPFPNRVLKPLDLCWFALRGHGRELGFVIALSALTGLLGMLSPLASGMLIDHVIPSAEVAGLWQMVVALFVAAVATMMFGIVTSVSMLRVETKMSNAMQSAVWDRVLKLPVPFLKSYATADLAMRINAVNTIREALTSTTLGSMLSGLFTLFNLFVMVRLNAQLSALAMGLLGGAVLIIVIFGIIKLYFQRQLMALEAGLSSMTLQYLRGIAKIRVAAAETRVFAKWTEAFTHYRGIAFRSQNIDNIEEIFSATYSGVVTAALFAAIGALLFQENPQKLSTGDFIAFNAAFGALSGGVMGFVGTAFGLLNLVPVYERALPILQSLPEASSTQAHPGELQGGIEAVGLRFRYGEGQEVLRDVSFSIQAGAYVALVGESGCGKTTLMRLLLGFEKPTAGTLYFDQQDIAGLNLEALRRQFGVVLQNGQLMAGDIFTNIVGASNLPLESAWEAARMVGLDVDILQMPMGMHTVIGEGTSTLSGGQRQRILIARALVNRPRILFFDEATSALDNYTQAIVTQSLAQLKSTRIVIAHRLSTVMHADRILVLQEGRIVQDGSFQELIAVPGCFRDMAQRQIVALDSLPSQGAGSQDDEAHDDPLAAFDLAPARR